MFKAFILICIIFVTCLFMKELFIVKRPLIDWVYDAVKPHVDPESIEQVFIADSTT